MNALQQLCHWQFSQQTFFKRSAISDGNWPFCDFEPPMGDLGQRTMIMGAYSCYLLNFFSMCYDWGATSEYRFKIGDFDPTEAGLLKIICRRGRPNQPFFFSENWAKWSFVPYKNLNRFFFRFFTIRVWRADGRTDRQTDRHVPFSSLVRAGIPCSAEKTPFIQNCYIADIAHRKP